MLSTSGILNQIPQSDVITGWMTNAALLPFAGSKVLYSLKTCQAHA